MSEKPMLIQQPLKKSKVDCLLSEPDTSQENLELFHSQHTDRCISSRSPIGLNHRQLSTTSQEKTPDSVIPETHTLESSPLAFHMLDKQIHDPISFIIGGGFLKRYGLIKSFENLLVSKPSLERDDCPLMAYATSLIQPFKPSLDNSHRLRLWRNKMAVDNISLPHPIRLGR
jgi:hypothetical protein